MTAGDAARPPDGRSRAAGPAVGVRAGAERPRAIMAGMSTTRRRAPLLVLGLLLLTSVLGGCGSGDDPEPPSEAASTSDAATSDAATAGGPGPAERGLPSDLPTELDGMCTAYAEMIDGVDAIDGDQELDALAVEMADVMRAWAEEVPGLDRPRGMSRATWRGLGTLAERIRALPEEPTMAQLEDVEKGLGRDEKAAVADASSWFQETCAIS